MVSQNLKWRFGVFLNPFFASTQALHHEFMSHALQISEQRRFERFGFDFGVKFLIGDIVNDNARLVDISAGGAGIRHASRPAIDSRIITYIENLDRFEGRVARLFRKGFAVEFAMSERKRERLKAAIETIKSGGTLLAPERRLAKRVSGEGQAILCRFDNGETAECTIVDCSVANATLLSTLRPFLGSTLRVGKTRARVVRHTGKGFAVEFEDYWNARPPADSYVVYN